VEKNIIEVLNCFKSFLNLPEEKLEIARQQNPHAPPLLGKNQMAIYIFVYKDDCLKVGKVGPNSQARYSYQHYNINSSRSNLANSLINDLPNDKWEGLTPENVAEWIKQNTNRFNILLDVEQGMPFLNLLEAFLQYHLKPCFEGYGIYKEPS
jgi:hypothetical protein